MYSGALYRKIGKKYKLKNFGLVDVKRLMLKASKEQEP